MLKQVSKPNTLFGSIMLTISIHNLGIQIYLLYQDIKHKQAVLKT